MTNWPARSEDRQRYSPPHSSRNQSSQFTNSQSRAYRAPQHRLDWRPDSGPVQRRNLGGGGSSIAPAAARHCPAPCYSTQINDYFQDPNPDVRVTFAGHSLPPTNNGNHSFVIAAANDSVPVIPQHDRFRPPNPLLSPVPPAVGLARPQGHLPWLDRSSWTLFPSHAVATAPFKPAMGPYRIRHFEGDAWRQQQEQILHRLGVTGEAKPRADAPVLVPQHPAQCATTTSVKLESPTIATGSLPVKVKLPPSNKGNSEQLAFRDETGGLMTFDTAFKHSAMGSRPTIAQSSQHHRKHQPQPQLHPTQKLSRNARRRAYRPEKMISDRSAVNRAIGARAEKNMVKKIDGLREEKQTRPRRNSI